MSIPAFGWALEQGRHHGLTTAERMVLIYLADKANGQRFCWPGQELIAAFTGLTTRSVRVCADRLERLGLIRQEWRGKVREYHVLRPVDGEEDNPHRKAVPVNNSPSSEAASHKHRKHVPTNGSDTGNPRHSHRKSTHKTPELSSDYPLREPRREPKTREEAREGSVGFSSRVEASKAEPGQPDPEREPTPAEIEAQRREHAEAMAELPPEMAAAIGGLGAALSGRAYEPGRPPLRSPADQEAALAPQRPRAAYASGDTLLALRRLSGIRSPAPALMRAAE
jgi:hypothetical protein